MFCYKINLINDICRFNNVAKFAKIIKRNCIKKCIRNWVFWNNILSTNGNVWVTSVSSISILLIILSRHYSFGIDPESWIILLTIKKLHFRYVLATTNFVILFVFLLVNVFTFVLPPKIVWLAALPFVRFRFLFVRFLLPDLIFFVLYKNVFKKLTENFFGSSE